MPIDDPLEKINSYQQLELLDQQLSSLEAIAQLPITLLSMRRQFDSLRQQVEILQQGKDQIAQLYKNFVNMRLENLDESRFWELPVVSRFNDSVFNTTPVQYRPRTTQGLSTRFVTMINLKGGVGKTTLSVNLASAFASGNYNNRTGVPLKVLVVDLDFQGSLSRLCLTAENVHNSRISSGKKAERTTSSWFLREIEKRENLAFSDLTYPSDIDGMSNQIDVIAADEYLDEVDVQQIVAQVMGGRETRFEYRRSFFQPEVLSKYDLILFDCPPRITPSSINALLASDYVIIPTRLDKINSDATARTLTWLGRMQKSNIPGSFPQLAGIIINFAKENPPQNFKNNLKFDLQDYCRQYLDTDAEMDYYIFNGQIKTTVNAAYPVDGGEKMRPLALRDLNMGQDPARHIQEAFGVLATQIYERIYTRG